MKKHILLIIFILISINLLKSNNIDSCINLSYDNLINYLIINANKENPSIFDDSVSKEIHTLVLYSPDSIISIERKLDLLNIFVFYNHHVSKVYRNYLFVELKNEKTKRIEYNIPLFFCYYCEDSTLFKKIKQIEFSNEIINTFPYPYKDYYMFLINLIKRSNNSEEFKTHLSNFNQTKIIIQYLQRKYNLKP
jgi:hypothetical protein